MIQTQSLDPTPSNYYQNIQHSQTFQQRIIGNGGGGIHNQQQPSTASHQFIQPNYEAPNHGGFPSHLVDFYGNPNLNNHQIIPLNEEQQPTNDIQNTSTFSMSSSNNNPPHSSSSNNSFIVTTPSTIPKQVKKRGPRGKRNQQLKHNNITKSTTTTNNYNENYHSKQPPPIEQYKWMQVKRNTTTIATSSFIQGTVAG
ncbi:unnamed protein product [Meloidogyne enterolobii]|uniref:Uncharacterized protein n=1 Tax=Meloidogyne enterolobii TaxID=390850 RepID=A0ACB0YQX6_MELEN